MDRGCGTSQTVEQEARFFRELIPVAGPDSETALNIIRAGHFLLHQFAANFRLHGLSEAQFAILVALEDETEGLSMADIARRMLVSRAGMSGVIRGMVAKGWVKRRDDKTDARAVRISLTKDGRDKLAQVLPDHLKLAREMISGCLEPAEKQLLIRLLGRLRGHLAERRAATTDT